MKNPFKIDIKGIASHPYLRNRRILFVFFSSIFLNLIIWILLYLKIKPSHQYPIPLHFNIYFGVDVIDYWQKIFIIPGLGLLFSLVNFFLGFLTYRLEKIVAYFLNSASLLLQLLLILGAMSSILIQS